MHACFCVSDAIGDQRLALDLADSWSELEARDYAFDWAEEYYGVAAPAWPRAPLWGSGAVR